MQHHAVPAGRVAALIDAMESLLLWRLEFKVHITSKAANTSVDGNPAAGFKKLAQASDISQIKNSWFIEANDTFPTAKAIQRYAADCFTNEPLNFGGFLSQEKR